MGSACITMKMEIMVFWASSPEDDSGNRMIMCSELNCGGHQTIKTMVAIAMSGEDGINCF